jgi:hypothetical protein
LLIGFLTVYCIVSPPQVEKGNKKKTILDTANIPKAETRFRLVLCRVGLARQTVTIQRRCSRTILFFVRHEQIKHLNGNLFYACLQYHILCGMSRWERVSFSLYQFCPNSGDFLQQIDK